MLRPKNFLFAKIVHMPLIHKVKQPLDEYRGWIFEGKKENTLPTSLIHDVTTFANVWVANTGFNLIFLSKHVNETHMAMHITTQN